MEFSNREYLGFAAYARSTGGQWRLHFNWRRIIVSLVALGIVGYFSLAFMLFCWFRYKQGWEETRYAEMLIYPFSLETRMALRRNIGNKMIAEAKKELKETQDYGSFLGKIRAGLIYSPENSDGRMDFSSFLFYQKRTQEGFDILKEGFPYALNNSDYVQFFIRQSLALTQDDDLIATAETFLPQFPLAQKIVPAPNNLKDNGFVFTIGAAQACLLRGYFDKSREILVKYKMEESLSGRVLLAQLEWETGAHGNALEILKNAVRLAPENDQIALLYAHYLKENGNVAEARDTLLRIALMKDDPLVRIRLISFYEGDENSYYRRRLEAEYFRRYGNNSAALLALLQYATNIQDYALTQRIYDHARKEALMDLPKFELLYLEAQILQGKAADALKTLDELNSGNYNWVQNYQGVLDSLRALAYFSANQENLGKISLERVIKNQSVTPERLIVLGRRLDKLGFDEESHRVYESAYLIDNRNQTVLLELVRYALDHQDVYVLLRYLPALIDTRRPPRSVLTEVRDFLGSDRMLFVAKHNNLVNEVAALLDKSRESEALSPEDYAKSLKTNF